MIRKVSRERCCPYAGCRHFGKPNDGNIAQHGFLKTKHGRKRRYRCKTCGKTFSSITITPSFGSPSWTIFEFLALHECSVIQPAPSI